MTELLHFAPLDSSDAKAIQRLQKKCFPPDLRENHQEIKAILLRTEEHVVCNFSFAVYAGTRMVGYVFAYVEARSIYHELEEDVLYIKEIALLPGHERMLRRLFLKLFQLWSAYAPGIPLEAHVLEDSLRNWKRMVRVFRHYGLSLSTRPEQNRDSNLPYLLLRLDVVASTASLYERPMALPTEQWKYSDDVSLTVLTDVRHWLSLKGEWDQLVFETPDANISQSFDYLWQWWKYYGIWRELRLVVIRSRGRAIGVVPLMLEYVPIFGKIFRNLIFLTSPMEMDRPKFLFGRRSDTCMPAFLAWLEQSSTSWDILDIEEQLLDAQTELLRARFKSSGYLLKESETLCPYISLDTTWEQFLSSRSRKMRSNIKRLRRRLNDLGDVELRVASQWPDLDDALDQYCEIEARSWKFGKRLHLTSDKSHLFFYRSLAQVFGTQGQFELRILECNGQPIAGTFGVIRNKVFLSLKIAHDEQYDKHSPGTVLESYELEELFDSDLELYDLMGSFLTNKLRWTSTVIKVTNMYVYQRRPRLLLHFFVYSFLKGHVRTALKLTGQFDRAVALLKKVRGHSETRR